MPGRIVPGGGGDFGGAGEHRRVAGPAGKVGPGADAEFGIAALQREVGEQRLEDGAGEQVFGAVACGRLLARGFFAAFLSAAWSGPASARARTARISFWGMRCFR